MGAASSTTCNHIAVKARSDSYALYGCITYPESRVSANGRPRASRLGGHNQLDRRKSRALRRLLPARNRSSHLPMSYGGQVVSAKAGRQLPERGELVVSERPPDGGADGAGVDRIGVALGLDLEALFPDAFLERGEEPGIGRRCPPGIGRHVLAGGRPPLAGGGCQAGDLRLGGSGGLCLRLEKR